MGPRAFPSEQLVIFSYFMFPSLVETLGKAMGHVRLYLLGQSFFLQNNQSYFPILCSPHQWRPWEKLWAMCVKKRYQNSPKHIFPYPTTQGCISHILTIFYPFHSPFFLKSRIMIQCIFSVYFQFLIPNYIYGSTMKLSDLW